MSRKFHLDGGQSCEVFNGTATRESKGSFVYRITLGDDTTAELKIITDSSPPIIVNTKTRHKCIDVSVSDHLYLQAIGKGTIVGTYEFLGCR